MSRKETHENRMEALIQEWEAKIEFLLGCADRANGDCKSKYYAYIESLQAKQQDLLGRLAGRYPSTKETAKE